MKRLLIALAAGASALVVGCSDPHAGEKCVESHDESYIWFSSQCLSYGANGACASTMQIPHYDTRTVCDKWVPVTTAPATPR